MEELRLQFVRVDGLKRKPLSLHFRAQFRAHARRVGPQLESNGAEQLQLRNQVSNPSTTAISKNST